MVKWWRCTKRAVVFKRNKTGEEVKWKDDVTVCNIVFLFSVLLIAGM